MKQMLPEYQRSLDGVEYIAIGGRCGTALGRALSLGMANKVESHYLGDFASLGGMVRYFARPKDPYATTAMGIEQDMEISTKFDDTYVPTFSQAMWDVLSKHEAVVLALAENKLPFVYFVNFDDGEGLQSVRMPTWYEEALDRCVRSARAGKFVKQAVKPTVELPPEVLVTEKKPFEQVIEAAPPPVVVEVTVIPPSPVQGKARANFRKAKVVSTDAAEVGVNPLAEKILKKQVFKKAIPAPTPTPVQAAETAQMTFWMQRLQLLTTEQLKVVNDILEPYNDMVDTGELDDELRNGDDTLMLGYIDDLNDKAVIDVLARSAYMDLVRMKIDNPVLREKLQSYFVPEEE